MSQTQLRKLYRYTKVVEQGTNATIKPFSDSFKTADRFIASVRRFKRALIAPLKWKKAPMKSTARCTTFASVTRWTLSGATSSTLSTGTCTGDPTPPTTLSLILYCEAHETGRCTRSSTTTCRVP